MPGMMRSKVSGRGVWCDCCSAWTVTRCREARQWRAEWDDEQCSPDREYDFYKARSEYLEKVSGDD